MEHYPSLIGFVMSMLVLLAAIAYGLRRRREDAAEAQDIFRVDNGRTPAPPRFDWSDSNSGWESALKKSADQLGDLKERAEDKGVVLPETPAAPLSVTDFSAFSRAERRGKAMQHLNARRGKKVKIITLNKQIHRGEVVTLTGTQVMLRDEGQVFGVNLEEVEQVES